MNELENILGMLAGTVAPSAASAALPPPPPPASEDTRRRKARHLNPQNPQERAEAELKFNSIGVKPKWQAEEDFFMTQSDLNPLKRDLFELRKKYNLHVSSAQYAEFQRAALTIVNAILLDPHKELPNAYIESMRWYQSLPATMRFFEEAHTYTVDAFGNFVLHAMDRWAAIIDAGPWAEVVLLVELSMMSCVSWPDMALNVILCGDAAVGKSFIFKTVSKVLPPGMWREVTHGTNLSHTFGGADDLRADYYDEITAAQMGVGKDVEGSKAESVLKARLSSPIVRTDDLAREDGERRKVHYISTQHNSLSGSYNGPLPPRNSPLCSRMWIEAIAAIDPASRDSIVNRATQLLDDNVEAKAKAIVHQCKLFNVYTMIIECYIYLGVMREVNMAAFDMWFKRIEDDLARRNYRIRDIRQKSKIRSLARSITVRYAVSEMLSDAAFSVRLARKDDNAYVNFFDKAFEFIQLVEPLLVCTKSITVFAVTLSRSRWTELMHDSFLGVIRSLGRDLPAIVTASSSSEPIVADDDDDELSLSSKNPSAPPPIDDARVRFDDTDIFRPPPTLSYQLTAGPAAPPPPPIPHGEYFMFEKRYSRHGIAPIVNPNYLELSTDHDMSLDDVAHRLIDACGEQKPSIEMMRSLLKEQAKTKSTYNELTIDASHRIAETDKLCHLENVRIVSADPQYEEGLLRRRNVRVFVRTQLIRYGHQSIDDVLFNAVSNIGFFQSLPARCLTCIPWRSSDGARVRNCYRVAEIPSRNVDFMWTNTHAMTAQEHESLAQSVLRGAEPCVLRDGAPDITSASPVTLINFDPDVYNSLKHGRAIGRKICNPLSFELARHCARLHRGNDHPITFNYPQCKIVAAEQSALLSLSTSHPPLLVGSSELVAMIDPSDADVLRKANPHMMNAMQDASTAEDQSPLSLNPPSIDQMPMTAGPPVLGDWTTYGVEVDGQQISLSGSFTATHALGDAAIAVHNRVHRAAMRSKRPLAPQRIAANVRQHKLTRKPDMP